MCTPAIVCCLCLGLVSPDLRLLAQDVRALQPGTRVRIASGEVAEPTVIIGTLGEVGPDSLTIQTSHGQVAVPIATITAAWRRTQPSQKKKGALIGAAVGLAVAGVFAALASDESGWFPSAGEVALSASLLFAPIGAGVGAIVAPREQWVTVPVSAPGADRWPTVHGVRVSYSIRF
jgi:hypothetical protein